jgi:glucosamine kinase
MSRVLGMDIGGTGSRARVSIDGRTVAEAEASSASLSAAGPATADAALARLLTRLLGRLPADSGPPFDAICAGAAGISVPETRGFLQRRLAPLTRSGTVVIVSDAMLVLPAAGLDAGVAVICGTGSVAVGSYQGRCFRAGGWGYLLGDEGSGYWIVRAAIRELLDRRDRGAPPGDPGDPGGPGEPGEPGDLGDQLLRAAGAADVAALAARFYARPRPRHWARYAPAVLEAADPAAQQIAAAAGRALAGLAVTAAERLAAPADLPIALGGGLIGHPVLQAAVRSALRDARPASEVVTLTEPPVAGAVRVAAAAVGPQPSGTGP